MVGGVRSGRRYKIGLFPVLLSLIEFLLIITLPVIVPLVLISLVELLLVAAWPVVIVVVPVTLLSTIMPIILLVVMPVVLVVILSRLEFPFLLMLTSVPMVHLGRLEGSVIVDDRLRLSRLLLHIRLALKMVLEVGELAELTVDSPVGRDLGGAVTHGRALGLPGVWPRSEGRGRSGEQRLP